MNAEQYLNKSELQLKRKAYDNVIESLEQAVNMAKEENDFVTLIQAYYFLGESMFMRGDYTKAREILSLVQENAEETEAFDDLLNDEVTQSDFLISLIDRYC